MMHEMVGQFGSLYLGGVLNCRMELTCSVRNAFSCTFIFLFTVQRSFKNLAYEGICFIASKSEMLILTYLNTSYISVFCCSFVK